MKSVYTIGHSTHSFEEFVEILHTYGITATVDVRRLPGSNRYPQFNQDALKKLLEKENIRYFYLAKLGGRRKSSSESINTGWKNKSFRGYADYMQTNEFQTGVKELLSLSREYTVALMCAEAVPWRCHRSLIADALLIRGIPVQDIYSKTTMKPHKLTPWSKVEELTITYPEQ